MRKIEVDYGHFELVARRDPYEGSNGIQGEAYLDLETGEVIWIHEERIDSDGNRYIDWGSDITTDESAVQANREARTHVASDHARFLELPYLDHREAFEEFVNLVNVPGVEYNDSYGGYLAGIRQNHGYDAFCSMRDNWNHFKVGASVERLQDYVRKEGGVEPVLK